MSKTSQGRVRRGFPRAGGAATEESVESLDFFYESRRERPASSGGRLVPQKNMPTRVTRDSRDLGAAVEVAGLINNIKQNQPFSSLRGFLLPTWWLYRRLDVLRSRCMYQCRCMNSVAERSWSTRLFTWPREKQRCARDETAKEGRKKMGETEREKKSSVSQPRVSPRDRVRTHSNHDD